MDNDRNPREKYTYKRDNFLNKFGTFLTKKAATTAGSTSPTLATRESNLFKTQENKEKQTGVNVVRNLDSDSSIPELIQAQN